jgi:HlyD family secretion protein
MKRPTLFRRRSHALVSFSPPAATGQGALVVRPVPRAVVPFLPDIEELAEERAPWQMRVTFHVLALLLTCIILAASLAKVDIVVQARGTLVADQPTIVLQPLERAVIRSILVKPGDRVAKGQVVATLDPTFSQADVNALSAEQRAAAAAERRIRAELDGAPLPPPVAINADEVMQDAQFRARSAQYAAQRLGYDKDILRLQGTIGATRAEMSAASRQLEVAHDVETMRSTLLNAHVGSRLQYLDAESTRIRAEHELEQDASALAQAQQQVEAKQAERDAFMAKWRSDLLEELGRQRATLARVQEALVKADRMRDLVVITAPQDAVVLDVAQRSVGSVLHEAEPIATLAPADATLIVEATVASADIGYVKPGDQVDIKVDAFPYTRHGMLYGRLQTIAWRASTPAGGPPTSPAADVVHQVRVEMTSTALRQLPQGVRLLPGMSVTADIEVGTRSIIGYVLYPITRGFDEVAREP